MNLLRPAAALLIPLFVAQPFAWAQSQDSVLIRERYRKMDVRITMRDSVRLFTSIYFPKDTTRKAPILLVRTPYSCAPYGDDAMPRFLGPQTSRYVREGYILVRQDVRGKYLSEGIFEDVRPYLPVKRKNTDVDETTDTYDTVDWLVKNLRHNNGNVGLVGTSYPAFYAWMGAIDAHPAVKAISPQAPVSAWMQGDDFFHNGAFLLPHAFDFFSGFGKPRPEPTTTGASGIRRTTPDGYAFFLALGTLPNANAKYLHDSVAFWNTIMEHGTWDDFWAARSILPHLNNVRPATMVVGGWFDTENLWGALNSYASCEKNDSVGYHTLVMGPWSHGQWGGDNGDSLGAIKWGMKTGTFYLDSIEIPFFNHFLKEEGTAHPWEAAMFETGENRWHFLPVWPPRGAREQPLFLNARGSLSWIPPDRSSDSCDVYVQDPKKPVPYTAQTTQWYNAAFMVEDQRFASRRPDVLVYQTDELKDDISVAGPIRVDFHVSTSGTDCDWVVKIIDVFPDSLRTPRHLRGYVTMGGYQMLVRGDVMRGKFRNSLSRPEPFMPGAVTSLRFALNDVFHRFKRGHRVMVHVQSSWFPMVDLNPGKFMNIFKATDNDLRPTTQRIYRSPLHPSKVILPVMK